MSIGPRFEELRKKRWLDSKISSILRLHSVNVDEKPLLVQDITRFIEGEIRLTRAKAKFKLN